MSTPITRDDQTPSLVDELAIDRLCTEFEDAWKAGEPAPIEDYLDRVSASLRSALLEELLAIELYYRRRRGDSLPFPEYRQRFPDLPETALVSLAEAVGAYHVNGAELPLTVTNAGDAAAPGRGRPSLPMRVGDYELVEEIAQGGMGIVYRARDVALDREVAVKVLRDRFPADSEIARRFLEEARITGQLQHPGIPPIHRVGTLPDGRPFIAMKLIKGQTLADLLDDDSKRGDWGFGASVFRGPLIELMADPTADRGRFIMVFEQICQAVAYAHAHQVIHRDLKPQNIMVGAFGEVQVMDWGLAKVLGEAPSARTSPAVEPASEATEIRSGRDPDSATEYGSLLGTPAFMSPEQAGGEVEKLGPASDVFGLGAILCVILTGRPPYVGDDTESIRLQAVRGRLEEAFAVLDKCVNAPAMVALAKRCLAVEPADRPANAAAVAAVVAGMRAAAAERARLAELARAEADVREAEQRKRRRVLRGFSAAGLFLAVGIALASVIAAGVYQKQKGRAEEAEADAIAQLWRAKLEEARSLSLSRRPGQRVESLAILREALAIARKTGLTEEDRLAFRNTAIGCLTLPDIIEEKVWEGMPGRAGWGYTFDFDAALELYAYSDAQGNVTVKRVQNDLRLSTIPGDARQSWSLVTMSPDGRYLAVSGAVTGQPKSHAKLEVWQLEADSDARLIHEVDAGFGIIAFRPDSKALAYLAADGRPAIVNLSTQQTRYLPGTGSGGQGISFSPNGRCLGVQQQIAGRWTLQLRDADSGVVIADLHQDFETCWHAWHPGGRIVAYSAQDRKIHLWDRITQQEVAAWEGHQTDGIIVAFDASGQCLLSTDWHGMLRIWDVHSGRQRLTLPAWGPKIAVGKEPGRFAVLHATDDGRLRLMKLLPGTELQEWAAQLPGSHQGWQEAPRHLSSVDDLLISGVDGTRSSTGMAAIDASTGQIVGAMNLGEFRPDGFDVDGALFTAGRLGCCRWPRSMDERAGTIIFGPPQQLSKVGEGIGANGGGVSADGLVLAVPLYEAGLCIIHRDGRTIPVNTGQVERRVAVSPDGRWVVSNAHAADTKGIRIWEAATGRLVKELPSGGYNVAGFSPDGGWLWSAGGEARLWHAGTWEPGPVVGGHHMAISADNRVVATGQGVDLVRLVHAKTGKDFAHLRTDSNERFRPEFFSADGSRLYAWAPQHRSMFVWDLRQIRAQLAEMNLDWELPAFSPPPPLRDKPLSVQFSFGGILLTQEGKELFAERKYQQAITKLDKSLAIDATQPEAYYFRGRARLQSRQYQPAIEDFDHALKLNPGHADAYHQRGHAHQYLGRYREALSDFRTSIEHKPEVLPHLYEMQASMHYHLEEYDQALAAASRSIDLNSNRVSPYHTQTLIYSLGPERLLDFKKALPLAERAVILGKNSAIDVNMLGIVHYRLDHLDDAIKLLEQATLTWLGKPPATNRFFLAMAYQRRKNSARAKELFDQALAWRKQRKRLSPAQVSLLDRLQTEAEKVLAGGKQR